MKITKCRFEKGREEIIASPRDRTWAGERGGGGNFDEKFACCMLVCRAGRGCSYLHNRLSITSFHVITWVPVLQGQFLSMLVLRYRDAKISLYLWHNSVLFASRYHSYD